MKKYTIAALLLAASFSLSHAVISYDDDFRNYSNVDGGNSFKYNLEVPQEGLSLARNGFHKDRVLELQNFLITKNCITQQVVNTGSGSFGLKTEAAVKAYQTANSISPVSGAVPYNGATVAIINTVSGGNNCSSPVTLDASSPATVSPLVTTGAGATTVSGGATQGGTAATTICGVAPNCTVNGVPGVRSGSCNLPLSTFDANSCFTARGEIQTPDGLIFHFTSVTDSRKYTMPGSSVTGFNVSIPVLQTSTCNGNGFVLTSTLRTGIGYDPNMVKFVPTFEDNDCFFLGGNNSGPYVVKNNGDLYFFGKNADGIDRAVQQTTGTYPVKGYHGVKSTTFNGINTAYVAPTTCLVEGDAGIPFSMVTDTNVNKYTFSPNACYSKGRVLTQEGLLFFWDATGPHLQNCDFNRALPSRRSEFAGSFTAYQIRNAKASGFATDNSPSFIANTVGGLSDKACFIQGAPGYTMYAIDENGDLYAPGNGAPVKQIDNGKQLKGFHGNWTLTSTPAVVSSGNLQVAGRPNVSPAPDGYIAAPTSVEGTICLTTKTPGRFGCDYKGNPINSQCEFSTTENGMYLKNSAYRESGFALNSCVATTGIARVKTPDNLIFALANYNQPYLLDNNCGRDTLLNQNPAVKVSEVTGDPTAPANLISVLSQFNPNACYFPAVANTGLSFFFQNKPWMESSGYIVDADGIYYSFNSNTQSTPVKVEGRRGYHSSYDTQEYTAGRIDTPTIIVNQFNASGVKTGIVNSSNPLIVDSNNQGRISIQTIPATSCYSYMFPAFGAGPTNTDGFSYGAANSGGLVGQPANGYGFGFSMLAVGPSYSNTITCGGSSVSFRAVKSNDATITGTPLSPPSIDVEMKAYVSTDGGATFPGGIKTVNRSDLTNSSKTFKVVSTSDTDATRINILTGNSYNTTQCTLTQDNTTGAPSETLAFSVHGNNNTTADFYLQCKNIVKGMSNLDSTLVGFPFKLRFTDTAPSTGGGNLAPGKPTNVTAVPGTPGTIVVSWIAPTGTVTATGYYVYKDGVKVSNLLTSTSFIVSTGISIGTTYGFTVTAVNGANESVASNPVNAAPTSSAGNPSVLSAPTGLSLVDTLDSKFMVTFNPVAGAVGYTLYVSTSLSTLNNTSSRYNLMSKGLGGDDYRFVVEDRQPNTTYYVNVVAYSETTGSFDSPHSAPLTVTTGSASASGTIRRPLGFRVYQWKNEQVNIFSSAVAGEKVNAQWIAAIGVGKYKLKHNNNEIEVLVGQNLYGFEEVSKELTLGSGDNFFKVQACNSSGVCGEWSPEIKIIGTAAGTDTTKPTAPTNLATTTQTSSSVSLSWTASTDAGGVTRYEVYRSTGSTGNAGQPTTVTSYTDNTVAPSTRYTYYVKAFDAAGNMSEPSLNIVVDTPAAGSAVAGPTGLSVSNVTNNQVTFGFDSASYPVDVYIYSNSSKYHSYHGYPANYSLGGVGRVSRIVENLMPGTLYEFKFYKVIGDVKSTVFTSISTTTKGTLTAPSIPNVRLQKTKTDTAIPTITSNNDRFYLSFLKPSGSYDETTIKVRVDNRAESVIDRNPSEFNDYHLDALGTNVENFKSMDLSTTTHKFEFAACNLTLCSSWASTTINIVCPPGKVWSRGNRICITAGATTAPGAPTSLTKGIVTSTTTVLSWTAPTTGTVTEYNVYRGATIIGSTNSTTRTYTAVGLTPSTAYTFTVKAVNVTTESVASNPVTVTTSVAQAAGQSLGGGGAAGGSASAVPSKPILLLDDAVSVRRTVVATTSLTFKWDTPSATSYKFKIDAPGYNKDKEYTFTATSSTFKMSDLGIASGVVTLTVKACNVSNRCSAYSSPVTVTVLAAPVEAAPRSVPVLTLSGSSNDRKTVSANESLSFSWSTPGATSYKFSIDAPGYNKDKEYTFTVASSTFKMSDLVIRSGVVKIKVRACNSVCSRIWSNTITVTVSDSAFNGTGSSSLSAQALSGSVLGAATSCVDLPRNIHRGAEGVFVKKLQSFLVEKGFLDDTITGFYGDKTVTAVKDYQVSRKLPETGMVYDFTRDAIRNETCN